jgi:hypothetical protein
MGACAAAAASVNREDLGSTRIGWPAVNGPIPAGPTDAQFPELCDGPLLGQFGCGIDGEPCEAEACCMAMPVDGMPAAEECCPRPNDAANIITATRHAIMACFARRSMVADAVMSK